MVHWRRRVGIEPTHRRFRADATVLKTAGATKPHSPDVAQVAQFADIDPRTAGKLLRNALTLGLVDALSDREYVLALPCPYKGLVEQKPAVVREAPLRLPVLAAVRNPTLRCKGSDTQATDDM
jgi:hypothetical protein